MISERDADRRQERRAFFEEEVTRLMDRLYGTALRLTRDADEAEDIVAESVAKAWARLGELRDLKHFEGWLFHIVNNTFISEWRRQRCRQASRGQTESEEPFPGGTDAADFSLFQKLHQPFLLWWGTPEERFLNDLLHQDLQNALDSLPDDFRIVVVLVEVQGYTYAEAAELLEVPIGTVRSRLSRARGLLQKALWRQAAEAGLRASCGGDRRVQEQDEERQ